MKKFLKWVLMILCLALLFGCTRQSQFENPGTVPVNSAPSSPAVPNPTQPENLEITENGTITAHPDRLYDFPDNNPVFSLDGTLYSSPVLVELKTEKPAAIYYTLDGTDPDRSDTFYDARAGIFIAPQASSEFPTPTVIKARAYYNDGTESGIAIRTYFVGDGVRERFTTAMFAINGDPAELTEGPDGIFFGENALERGDETEREVFVEAWDKEGRRMFCQYSGLRIFGGFSRNYSIKSMKLYARKRYSSGVGKFHTGVFETPIENGSGELVAEYDKLVLRNTGNDFQYGFIRDELCHALASQAGFTDYEAAIPAVVYLNGEYYGLFWLRESYCDDYFKNKYPNNAAKGEFVVIEGTESWKTEDPDGGKEAQAKAYNEMYRKYAYADLTNESIYQALRQQVDIENYLRYFAFNIYINNIDWPGNNYKCYRYIPQKGEALTGVYDGRWRYLLHDTDYSTHLYESGDVAPDCDYIRLVLDPKSDRYAPLLAALMHRADCRTYFMEYLQTLSEGAMSCDSVTNTLSAMHTLRASEQEYMFLHIDALRRQGDESLWSNMGVLEYNLELIRNFAKNRPEYILKYAAEALQDYQ